MGGQHLASLQRLLRARARDAGMSSNSIDELSILGLISALSNLLIAKNDDSEASSNALEMAADTIMMSGGVRIWNETAAQEFFGKVLEKMNPSSTGLDFGSMILKI